MLWCVCVIQLGGVEADTHAKTACHRPNVIILEKEIKFELAKKNGRMKFKKAFKSHLQTFAWVHSATT